MSRGCVCRLSALGRLSACLPGGASLRYAAALPASRMLESMPSKRCVDGFKLTPQAGVSGERRVGERRVGKEVEERGVDRTKLRWRARVQRPSLPFMGERVSRHRCLGRVAFSDLGFPDIYSSTIGLSDIVATHCYGASRRCDADPVLAFGGGYVNQAVGRQEVHSALRKARRHW